MKENRLPVQNSQQRIKNRLKKNETLGQFNKEMESAFVAGTVTVLTQKEIDEWTGLVNYNTVFPVLNEASHSTKLRIVLNSARPN